jgi:hypothetical protein
MTMYDINQNVAATTNASSFGGLSIKGAAPLPFHSGVTVAYDYPEPLGFTMAINPTSITLPTDPINEIIGQMYMAVRGIGPTGSFIGPLKTRVMNLRYLYYVTTAGTVYILSMVGERADPLSGAIEASTAGPMNPAAGYYGSQVLFYPGPSQKVMQIFIATANALKNTNWTLSWSYGIYGA